jgi:hypothetical protein
MQLQRCDSCGETSPATGSAGATAWVTSEGADGCVKLALTLVRKVELEKVPEYARTNLREGDVYYSQATTTLDLCARCGERVIASLGVARVKEPAGAPNANMVVVSMDLLKEALGHE